MELPSWCLWREIGRAVTVSLDPQVSGGWSDEGRRQEVVRILGAGDLPAVPPSGAVSAVQSLTWCGVPWRRLYLAQL